MNDIELLGAQWQTAARALGIACIAPFTLERSGQRYHFACLIPNFGAPQGTLISTQYPREAARVAKEMGYTCSSMLPNAKQPMTLESVKECLKDWGWASEDAAPPDWYGKHGV